MVVDDSVSSLDAGFFDQRGVRDSRIKFKRGVYDGDAAAVCNEALRMASGDFVAVVNCGDRLAPEALYAVAVVLSEHPTTDVIYSDEDEIRSDSTRRAPFFKPDWSPDFFLSYPYTLHIAAYRRALVMQAEGFRKGFDGAHEYDLALRIVERTQNIQHIPQVLYHARAEAESPRPRRTSDSESTFVAETRAINDYIRRHRIAATCTDAPGSKLCHRVRYRIAGEPLISIIIPTAGVSRTVDNREIDLLANCVTSIVRCTEYKNYEVLCVVDGELRAETGRKLDALEDARVRVLAFSEPFNFSRKINFGAAHAEGAHFLLLNDDTEVLTGEWLTAMLEFSQQPEVGAVGAKLYFPNRAIQHAGVIVPPADLAPGHVFYGYDAEKQKNILEINAICNYSAVTAACLMTRRDMFAEVGGFDESFPVNYNDVDYCLKVRERGRRIVYTPYAELLHYESVSRIAAQSSGVKSDELKRFSDLWSRKFTHDPYYNSLLHHLYFDPLFDDERTRKIA